MQKWEYALIWFDEKTKEYGITDVQSDYGKKQWTCSVRNKLVSEALQPVTVQLVRNTDTFSVFLFKRSVQKPTLQIA